MFVLHFEIALAIIPSDHCYRKTHSFSLYIKLRTIVTVVELKDITVIWSKFKKKHVILTSIMMTNEIILHIS